MSLLEKLESTCEDIELMIIINETELEVFTNMKIGGDMANEVATQQSKLKNSLNMNQLTLAGLKERVVKMKKDNFAVV